MGLLKKLTNWPPHREKVGRWVLFGVTAPLIVGWLFPILMCLIFAGRWKSLRFEPTLVLTAQWRDRAAKRWGYSTTILRGIMYEPENINETAEADTRTERHEHVHVRQFEDICVTGLLMGLLALVLPPVHEWWALWAFAPVFIAVQWLTAWMRGGDPYRDAEFERSAYAQTDMPRHLEESWQERRERLLAAVDPTDDG